MVAHKCLLHQRVSGIQDAEMSQLGEARGVPVAHWQGPLDTTNVTRHTNALRSTPRCQALPSFQMRDIRKTNRRAENIRPRALGADGDSVVKIRQVITRPSQLAAGRQLIIHQAASVRKKLS